uniref:Core Histone H2A/H2B/H3 domain-containing protein n=1 Tax=Dromaius novaehollandiae TaxID=8790 RepID=A0A8C4K1H3_DRONO
MFLATMGTTAPCRKRARKAQPDAVVLGEIHHEQMSQALLNQKVPFQRLWREIAQDFSSDLYCQSSAIRASGPNVSMSRSKIYWLIRH